MPGKGYALRSYRSLEDGDLRSFRVVVKETDLLIRVDAKSYREDLPAAVEKAVYRGRVQLETYMADNPDFKGTLEPWLAAPQDPPLVRRLARAANPAGVGPMAAVAGAFAELAGDYLKTRCREVLVENGGDIYIFSSKKRRIAVLAGESPLSNRLALEVPPRPQPWGVCTSSRSGPSLSLGRADAAVILAESPALADAVATAAANRVQVKEDVQGAVVFAAAVRGVFGVLVIKGDTMGAKGQVNLVELPQTGQSPALPGGTG